MIKLRIKVKPTLKFGACENWQKVYQSYYEGFLEKA